MNIIVNSNETKEILVTELSDIEFVVNKYATLVLKIASLGSFKNINIHGEVKEFANLKVYFADFSKGTGSVISKIVLSSEGADATWELASLTSGNDNKNFDISFVHKNKNTKALVNNYGVALKSSSLKFMGVNHIINNAKKSISAQNAKIIVFDKAAKGKASPILKIDENDVVASHSAIVGRVNDDHLFYLTSRGLKENEARALIVKGYLFPIMNQFDEGMQNDVYELVKGQTYA